MEFLLIGLLVFLASTLGTISGFGISTIMVPVLLFFFPLTTTLLFVGIVHWFGSLWKLLLFKRGLDKKLILTFGVPGIAASYIGASAVFSIPESVLSKAIGTIFIIYVLFISLEPGFRIGKSTTTSGLGGLAYGFLAGISGIGGAVRSAFLTLYNLRKEVFISTSGAIALFIDTTRLTTYLTGGARLDSGLLWGLLVYIPISFMGARLAKKLVEKIPQNKFRIVIGVFLLLMGAKLLFG